MTKEKAIRIITIVSILLISVAVMCFTLGSVESSGKSWKVEPLFNKTDGYLNESVILEKEGTVDKIFVRIGNVYNTDKSGGITFTVDVSSSEKQIKETSYIAFTRFELYITPSENSTLAPGWYLLESERGISNKSDLGISNKYVKFSTKQSFDFDEIIFIDKDGKQIEAVCYGGYDNIGGRKFVSAKDDDGTFSSVADGQKSFAFDSKSVLSATEEELFFTASNLYAYDGSYVSTDITPFGAIVNGLGVLLFGATPFGVRFMPFIFSVLTAILLYFFAEKIFGGYRYAIVAVVAWLLTGLGLSIGGVATVTSSALFFLLLAFYCFYLYYSSKEKAYTIYRYKPLIGGGLSLSFALGCDPFVLAALPAAITICVFTAVKPIAVSKREYSVATGLAREYARERYVGTLVRTILWSTLCLIVIPFAGLVLSYVIFYPIYSVVYSKSGFFAVAFSAIGSALSGGGSNAFGWLIGLGSEEFAGIAPRAIFANKAVVVISLALSVFTAVYWVLFSRKNTTKSTIYEKVALKADYAFLTVTFVLTFIFGLLFGIRTDYSRFAYSLIFLIFAIPYSYKEYGNSERKMVFGLIMTAVIVISALFFILSVVGFLGINLPNGIADYLYGWML